MTAPSPAPASYAERPTALETLRQSRADFVDALRAVPAADWERSPAAGRWSAAQIAEHVIRIERQMRKFLPEALSAAAPDPARRGAAADRDATIQARLRDRTQALTAPERTLPEGGRYATTDAAVADFDEARGAVIAFAESTPTDLRAVYVPHPRLGEIDGHQWLLFVGAHTDRHAAQLRELRGQLAEGD